MKHLRKIATTVMLLALSGCAAVRPTSVRIYAEHVSHASQHFGATHTDYGYNTLNLELHWQHGPAFMDLAEGVNLSPRTCGTEQCYGALEGPRELFTARAGLEFGL